MGKQLQRAGTLVNGLPGAAGDAAGAAAKLTVRGLGGNDFEGMKEKGGTRIVNGNKMHGTMCVVVGAPAMLLGDSVRGVVRYLIGDKAPPKSADLLEDDPRNVAAKEARKKRHEAKLARAKKRRQAMRRRAKQRRTGPDSDDEAAGAGDDGDTDSTTDGDDGGGEDKGEEEDDQPFSDLSELTDDGKDNAGGTASTLAAASAMGPTSATHHALLVPLRINLSLVLCHRILPFTGACVALVLRALGLMWLHLTPPWSVRPLRRPYR